MSLPQPNGRIATAQRATTLVITNAIKLGGLYIAISEISTQPQPRLAEMAIALFMMTGAEISEGAVLGLAARMFGWHPPDPPEEP